jgi:hypothetical protein
LIPATTALYRLAPPAFLAAYTFHFKVKQKLDEAALRGQLSLAGYNVADPSVFKDCIVVYDLLLTVVDPANDGAVSKLGS